MYTLFISDVHLNPEQPAITALFLHLLKTSARNADALYILGDLFEIWVGDDERSELANSIKQGLQDLNQSGVPVYIMPGNRDFLLGKRFMLESGCQQLSDPTVIKLYDVPTLLMHGDLLCTDDIPYLKFRAWTHNPFIQQLFLNLPLKYRQKIAERLREKSKNYIQGASRQIMDATQNGIEHYLRYYQTHQIIHGHTHRPAIHIFKHANHLVQRFVLSDWDDKGHVLVCYANGEKRLVKIMEMDV